MSVAQRPVHRPLSPHLQIYKWQLTSVLSILHRMTGIALSFGALYLATWVVFAAASPRSYAMFQDFNISIVGRIVLAGWLFSAFYHLCNGIRHLFWDAGKGFELKQVYASGYTVLATATTLTALTWGYVLFVAGGAA